jgi:MraZ protein
MKWSKKLQDIAYGIGTERNRFIKNPHKNMLLGEYIHTLDPKKRLSLPAKFRKEVGRTVVLTRGLDKCLFLYSVKQWEKVAEKLSDLSMGQADTRGFNRFMLAGAVELDVDSLGRILVPDFLKDFAELKTKVVITGVHDRAEIWDDVRWGEYKKRIDDQADALAQKLGELGVF